MPYFCEKNVKLRGKMKKKKYCARKIFVFYFFLFLT